MKQQNSVGDLAATGRRDDIVLDRGDDPTAYWFDFATYAGGVAPGGESIMPNFAALSEEDPEVFDFLKATLVGC